MYEKKFSRAPCLKAGEKAPNLEEKFSRAPCLKTGEQGPTLSLKPRGPKEREDPKKE